MHIDPKKIYHFVLKLLAIIFSIVNVSALIYLSAAHQGILFVLYILFYVLMPGTILYYWLDSPRILIKLNGFLRITIVFYLGMLILFIQYFLLKMTGFVWLIKFTVPFTALIAAVFLVKYRGIHLKKIKFRIGKLLSMNNLFVYLISSAVLLLVSIRMLMEYPAKELLEFQDFIWHIGNINMLAGNTFQDYRVLGVGFSYHYFSDLFFAICNIIFKTEAYNCIVGYPVIYVPSLLVISVYGFFKQMMTKYSEQAARIATIILLFFPTVSYTYCNSFFDHWLTNVNAVSLALPCLLIILALIKIFFESAQKTAKKSLLKLLFMIFSMQLLLSGLKGPFAATVIGGFVFYFILTLRYRQNQSMNLSLLAALGTAFGIIYAFLLSKGANSGLVILNKDYILDVVTYNSNFMKLYDSIVSVIGSELFAKLILLIPNFALVAGISGFVSIFAIFLLLFQYIKGVQIKNIDLFLLAYLIVGMGGYYLMAHIGNSQMYFLFAALPVITNMGVKFLTDHWPLMDVRLSLSNILKIVPIYGALFIILISFAGNVSDLKISINVAKDNILYMITGANLPESVYTITRDEIEGLEWIRANTEDKTVCATNKHYIHPDRIDSRACWFYDSAYSARQYYIEGYFYSVNSGYDISQGKARVKENDKLFSCDYTNKYKYELAENLGIDYLAIHKNEEQNCVPSGNNFAVRFENENIVIVQIVNVQPS